MKLAEKLNAAARKLGKKLNVLIEINVGGEPRRAAFQPDSAELETCCSPHLALKHSISRADDRSSIYR